jgi:hypothetical protein
MVLLPRETWNHCGAVTIAPPLRRVAGVADAPARVVLSQPQIDRFARDGFLVLDCALVSTAELAVVRRYIDDLFDHFSELPRDLAYDLGDVQTHTGPQQIAEINDASKLEPRLAATAAFARCRDLARQLLGSRVSCTFDHAICKPPHNDAATDWHQDLAYSPQLAGRDAVHIWLALQDVTEANGCMQFVPDATGQGLLPHRPRGNGSHALVACDFDPAPAVACPISAGMATLHQLTTLHYSGPNTTDEPRLAWIMHFQREVRRPLKFRIRAKLSRVKRALFVT